MSRIAIDFGRMLGLFHKGGDAVACIDIKNTKLVGFTNGNWNTAYGKVGSSFDVKPNHFAVVHFVDMVCRENDDVFWVGFFDDINVLVDGIRSAFIPVFVNSLLRGQDFDIFIELRAEEIPTQI